MKKCTWTQKHALVKMHKAVKLYIAVFLVLGIAVAPWNRMEAHAVEILATVNGTVLSGTNTGLLKLSTREGYMEIKLDSGTDITACKILLPDKRVSVAVTYGSDGYLHAAKITSETQESSVTLDSSATATITGQIGDKTTGNVLYVSTSQGEMEIKLDATTDVSGCSLLVVGKSYNITCMRGSDAYMHAARIYDIGVAAPTTPIGDQSNRDKWNYGDSSGHYHNAGFNHIAGTGFSGKRFNRNSVRNCNRENERRAFILIHQ